MTSFYQKFVDNNAKGIVEVINLYDSRYGVIMVDGKFVTDFHKSSGAMQAQLYLKEIKKLSKKEDKELSFYFVEWEDYGCDVEQIGQTYEYDANDFDKKLKVYFDFIDQNKNLVTFDSKYIRKIASSETEFTELAKSGYFRY